MIHRSFIPLLAWLFALGAAQAQLIVPGLLKFETYTNITGTPITGLTEDPRYPASPSQVLYLTAFDTRTAFPDDSHENYGGRITGFVTPVLSGNYEFFLRSDDASQLLLSTDETEANLAQVAEETGCCGAFEDTLGGHPR
ncbi:MAG: hypothetical protein EXS36_07615 [Pedosphaera sp.]|nr:hypothetical protein [Pedosphaera sp.]